MVCSNAFAASSLTIRPAISELLAQLGLAVGVLENATWALALADMRRLASFLQPVSPGSTSAGEKMPLERVLLDVDAGARRRWPAHRGYEIGLNGFSTTAAGRPASP